MVEISIKAHTRRGKGGKTIQVRSYSRRVGRKGIHSPKRDRSAQSGEEFESKVKEKKESPKLTPEELAHRREVMEGFKRAEAERRRLGMSRERYSRYKLKQQIEGIEEEEEENICPLHKIKQPRVIYLGEVH